jgi:hypothetical protein
VSTPEPSFPPREPPPLPRRDPRPLWLHMAVDTAVAFLALALLFWIVALPFWLTIVTSVIAGLAAAPFTRSAEERALAERPEATP